MAALQHLSLLFKRDIEKLELDPSTQYRFHFVMAWFWLACMPASAVAFFPHTAATWLQLLIFEVSLWANFATHLGAMSAALAAKASSAPPTRADILTAVEGMQPGDIITPSTPSDPAKVQAAVRRDLDRGLLD
jgi:hypothetical protein